MLLTRSKDGEAVAETKIFHEPAMNNFVELLMERIILHSVCLHFYTSIGRMTVTTHLRNAIRKRNVFSLYISSEYTSTTMSTTGKKMA